MQKESKPGTPKSNGAKKGRTTGTPEHRLRNMSGETAMPTVTRTSSLRQRATMVPGDFFIPPGLVTKRRIGNPMRLNTTISQTPAQAPMKSDLEIPDNELGLLYDKYLQSKAIEIIIQKKIAEKEQAMTIQMVATARERSIVKNKLEKAKLRENDIRNLNIMQASIDQQSSELNACFDDLRENKVKEKLLELKTTLEPLDELRCHGIITPEDSEAFQEFLKRLEAIREVLSRIKESSGDKGEVYQDVEKGLNSLRMKHMEIECVKKKFDEVLCELQVLVLKNASQSLSQNCVDELN